MDATISFTTEFFDNLSRYKNNKENEMISSDPHNNINGTETKSSEPDEYFLTYDDDPPETNFMQPQPLLDRIPYTRATELPIIYDVSYETEAQNDEIIQLD